VLRIQRIKVTSVVPIQQRKRSSFGVHVFVRCLNRKLGAKLRRSTLNYRKTFTINSALTCHVVWISLCRSYTRSGGVMLVLAAWIWIGTVLFRYTCSLIATTRRHTNVDPSFLSMQLFFAISLLLALLAAQLCHGYNMQSYRGGGLWIPGGGGASSVDNKEDLFHQQAQRSTISSSLSSRSSVSMTTQRETIRMPSQKPMVPYKVSCLF
jgi:hypothetical protein